MHLRAILTAGVLVSTVTASVLNLNIYTDSDGGAHDQAVLTKTEEVTADDKPAWKKRDELHLVPLVPEARTGVLPIELEEALLFALGPRFANEFIKAGVEQANNETSALAGSCNPFKCGGIAIKAIPCVAAAIKCKCVAPILSCSVPKSDICGCVGCLPGPLQKFLESLGFCPASLDDLATISENEHEGLDYADYIPYSQRDTNLLAFRGDISKTTITEAKALASSGFCPGRPCGSCSCCLGGCVLDTCLGVCLPFDKPESAHHEL